MSFGWPYSVPRHRSAVGWRAAIGWKPRMTSWSWRSQRPRRTSWCGPISCWGDTDETGWVSALLGGKKQNKNVLSKPQKKSLISGAPDKHRQSKKCVWSEHCRHKLYLALQAMFVLSVIWCLKSWLVDIGPMAYFNTGCFFYFINLLNIIY